MAPTIDEIEDRLSKLEKSKEGRGKFYLQYLVSPLLVVLLGLSFNWQIEAGKKDAQQLQLASSMLDTLFADNELKTLATKRLMDEVLQREDLRIALGKIVDEYLSTKFRNSIEQGDIAKAKQISDAATLVGGNSGEAIAAMIQANPSDAKVISKYDEALRLEAKAYDALLRGDAREAIQSLEEAEKVYPSFHTVSEVAQLLRRNEGQFSEPMVQEQVIKDVLKNHSWKLPPEVIERLEDKSATLEELNQSAEAPVVGP